MSVKKNSKELSQNEQLIKEIDQNKKKLKNKSFLPHFFKRIWKGKSNVFKKGFGGIVDDYDEFEKLKIEKTKKYLTYKSVVHKTTDSNDYYILLILSCLITTMGLYLNSPAIIIGAMIVAPLMRPIFGLSAGTLWGSGKVIFEAITTLLKGIIVVLIITALITYITPYFSITKEMLSRTIPNFADLIVALCCGLIGAYAYVNRKITSAIPGVAISVALMPPICTIGIGIGLNNINIIKGASLLFGLNIIGISLGAVIVFYLVKLHPESEKEEKISKVKLRIISHILISTVLLIGISIPLVLFGIKSYKFNQQKTIIRKLLKKELSNNKIFSLKIPQGNPCNVEMIILKENKLKISTKKIEKMLSKKLYKQVRLKVFIINQLK